MGYKLAIFDLDGTLLDTLGDLAASINHALTENGMPERTTDEVRRFVGNGVEKLTRRAVPAGTSEATIMKTLNDFRAHYNTHSNDRTQLYPGMRELLERLRENGVKIAVHSNKYDAAVQELCKLHLAGLYDNAAGEGTRSPKKPDPTGAQTLMKECGAEKHETIYVGDSEVDLATAKNAGIDVAWVSWGFRKANEIERDAGVKAFDNAAALGEYIMK